MSKNPSDHATDPSDEIIALVGVLHQTQQRLKELTDGQVDAVLHPGGESYLLQEAQGKLRQSEAVQRELAETMSAILNALPAHIALLDQHGAIISVNDMWQEFATGNELQWPHIGTEHNYVEICDKATGEYAEEAHKAAAGIRSVLNGSVGKFVLEYSCHSPTEKRWFELTATPVHGRRTAGAVVMHINVTKRKLADEAVRQSEEQFRSMFNVAVSGIAIVTPQGCYLRANQSFCQMLGYSEDELRAMNFAAVTHPEDLGLNLDLVDDLLAGRRENVVMEKRYLKKDGSILWARVNISATHGAGGEIETLIVMTDNITQSKLAEQKVAEQVELISIASRVGKLGAWTIEFPGPKIIWSEEVYRIHAVDPSFQPDLELALDFFPTKSRKKLEAAIRSGKAYDLELDFINANGQKRWVRTTSEVEKKNGEHYRFYGIFQDLTDRKTAEMRFRRLVDSNAQGVIFWNRTGEITGCNDSFLTLVGYSRADLEAGRVNWISLTPPEHAHLDQRAMDQLASKGVCDLYEKEYFRKDGSRVPILLGCATFEDNPNEGVCFILDLTERKKLEHQFLRAQRMESIGTLAGGIAHDLNNILAPIMMAVQILKLTATDDQAKTFLETIEVSSKRGADIVRQVLSFARGVEGERLEIQPNHLLNDIKSIIRDTFPKNIRLELSFPTEDSWTILGDPTQLHQILLNLCVNARDAMPGGGILGVSFENIILDEQYAAMNIDAKAGKYVTISVTDTGTGISPDILDKIFEPFFTTKELGKGTGLGLSTVIALVKSHGGFINVYSELGHGTSFKAYLPAVEVAARKTGRTGLLPRLPRGNGETVLIVDDEPSILTITGQTLESFGYRTLIANEGAEAVALYAQMRDRISVVLTDMAMPIMDGKATIRALRKINPSVKIIAASGLKTKGGEAKTPDAGVNFYLTKPYTAGVLLNTLHAILAEPETQKLVNTNDAAS